ncbi:MAG TPA: hypothetical protein PK880_05375 [Candidatus Competibacter sp.]|uniref:Uncharacterized protein n=1 Tax=Candidatus Competibacter denitrificans Run_A_D11 TaxID=1400863 RepID=W6M8Q2_9GAMM|nr:hypothetical protein [Candidatus Competibacter denitrificans]CDI04366.1 hypothetical protein BN873_950049 [Candidatus Competibacter denitrificans Run_A_D11]HRC71948.1 hypothetical protein [Candidatus Competibacter sp.]
MVDPLEQLLAWARATAPLALADPLDRPVRVETAVCLDRINALAPRPARESRDLRSPFAAPPRLLPP